MNPGHQPERFQVYKELPDGTGFTIADSPHVFLFDRYGGWSDEYGNYYNERGEPDDPPSSESHSHSEQDSQSRSSRSSRSYESDPYEDEFGPPGDYSDQDEQRQQEGAAVTKNLYNLQAYPEGQLLRIYVRNLPFKVRKEELLKAYGAHVEGIVNVIVDKDEDGRGIGTGYFIAKPATAERLVRLEGKRLLQRPLHFEIEQYENFIVFPVEQRELGAQPPFPTKRFVPKHPEKQEKVVPQEAKWRWYRFEKSLFPKKSDFRNWMAECGFNAEEDFRNIEKMENDPERRFVKVEMKESVFAAINGLLSGERPVQFTPI